MSDHTPGPWRVHQNTHEPYPVLIESDGLLLASVWIGPRDVEQAQANARLIAVAPELLEVCEEIFDCPHWPVVFPCEWHEKLRAAIAKTKGTKS